MDTQLRQPHILVINCGSSTVKLALYAIDDLSDAVEEGQIEGVGTNHAQLKVDTEDKPLPFMGHDHPAAAMALMGWLERRLAPGALAGVGHRIVHGMQHTQPQCVTPELMEDLKTISAYDPEHLPTEISWIEAFQKQYPQVPQVACFDTAFHDTMPRVAKQLPLPRRYYDKGIRRYGFHGLSYAYLMQQLARASGEDIARGRIVIAHLGNGASLAAVREGQSVDTSMAFTPTAGIPMSTRTGDLDPGVAWYLLQIEQMDPAQFSALVNRESGLLGLSETSGDMRELLKRRQEDSRAEEAIEFFCYQVRKYIGALAAALGGIDTLIFSGGIGEHMPEVRRRICLGLEFLGIAIDEGRNQENEPVISRAGKVTVRVMATNEQVMIARMTSEVLEQATLNVKT
jgi:acetate kinase